MQGYFVNKTTKLVEYWCPSQEIYDIVINVLPPSGYWFFEQNYVGRTDNAHYDDGAVHGNPILKETLLETLTTGLIGAAVDPHVANLLGSIFMYQSYQPNKAKGLRRTLEDLGIPYDIDLSPPY
jgi:hypothetical protein